MEFYNFIMDEQVQFLLWMFSIPLAMKWCMKLVHIGLSRNLPVIKHSEIAKCVGEREDAEK